MSIRITKVINAANLTLCAQYSVSKLGVIASSSIDYGAIWKWKNTTSRSVTLTCKFSQYSMADAYCYTRVFRNTTGEATASGTEIWENACGENAYSSGTCTVTIPAGYYIVVQNEHYVKVISFTIEEK